MKPYRAAIGLVGALVFISMVFIQCSSLSEREKAMVEQFTQRLRIELALTDAQTARVRKILTESQKQARRDRARYRNDRQAMRQAGMERMRATDAKIEAILTDEQKAKYEEVREQMREEFRQRAREGRRPGD